MTEAEFAYARARNRMHFHSLLVGAFKRSGLTQEEVSGRSGVPVETVNHILLRPRNMQIDLFSRLLFAMTGATATVAEEFTQPKPPTPPPAR